VADGNESSRPFSVTSFCPQIPNSKANLVFPTSTTSRAENLLSVREQKVSQLFTNITLRAQISQRIKRSRTRASLLVRTFYEHERQKFEDHRTYGQTPRRQNSRTYIHEEMPRKFEQRHLRVKFREQMNLPRVSSTNELALSHYSYT
jgi:hypothetical protein